MLWTDDPVRDFERWDEEQERWLKTLPVCDMCREPIQDEKMYVIGINKYCQRCMEDCEVENTALTDPIGAWL